MVVDQDEDIVGAGHEAKAVEERADCRGQTKGAQAILVFHCKFHSDSEMIHIRWRKTKSYEQRRDQHLMLITKDN